MTNIPSWSSLCLACCLWRRGLPTCGCRRLWAGPFQRPSWIWFCLVSLRRIIYFVKFSKFYWRQQYSFGITLQSSKSQDFSQRSGMKIFLCPRDSNLLMYSTVHCTVDGKVDNDIDILILCSSYSSIPIFIMLCLTLSFMFAMYNIGYGCVLDPVLARKSSTQFSASRTSKKLKHAAKHGFRRIQSDSRLLIEPDDSD